MCSEGDLGGFLPGEPREEGGLVEGFGEGSGPVAMQDSTVRDEPKRRKTALQNKD